MPTALLLEGESGSLTVPVPAYLIAHPKGYALFDSGLHVDTQVDADRHLGRLPVGTPFGGRQPLQNRHRTMRGS